jgi:ATP-dependent protease ClpP protease subunit
MLYNDQYLYCVDPEAQEPIMLLQGGIGEWDVVMGSIFAKELYNLDNLGKRKVQIVINSVGGSVIDAMSIYAAIRETKMQVNTFCAGVALSSAAIIFLSGENRVMADYSKLMVHNPYNLDGSIDKGLIELRDSIVKMICKDNGNEEEISAMMDQETWINAQQAFNAGFATEIKTTSDKRLNIIEDKKETTILNEAKRIYNISTLVMNKFIHELQDQTDNKKDNDMEVKADKLEDKKGFSSFAKTLAEISNKGKAEAVDKTTVSDVKNSSDEGDDNDDEDADERREDYEDGDTMDSKEMGAECSKEMETVDEEPMTEEIMDKDKMIMDMKNKMESMEKEMNSLKEAKAKSEKDTMAKRISDMLNVFVKSGKIKNDADTLNAWTSQAEKDFDTTYKLLNSLKVNKTATKIEDKLPAESRFGTLNKANRKDRILDGVMQLMNSVKKTKETK